MKLAVEQPVGGSGGPEGSSRKEQGRPLGTQEILEIQEMLDIQEILEIMGILEILEAQESTVIVAFRPRNPLSD